MSKTKRYIEFPDPKPLVFLSGQRVVSNEVGPNGKPYEKPVMATPSWWMSRLLQDPRFKGDFDTQEQIREIMLAVRAAEAPWKLPEPTKESSDEDIAAWYAQGGYTKTGPKIVVELSDYPHWNKLQETARKPQGGAEYDPQLAETNYEHASAIIKAGTTDPRPKDQPAEEPAEAAPAN